MTISPSLSSLPLGSLPFTCEIFVTLNLRNLINHSICPKFQWKVSNFEIWTSGYNHDLITFSGKEFLLVCVCKVFYTHKLTYLVSSWFFASWMDEVPNIFYFESLNIFNMVRLFLFFLVGFSIVFGIYRSSLNLDWVPPWMFSRSRNPIIYSTKPIIFQLSKSWSIMCYKIFQHWDFLSMCSFHCKSLTWFIKSKYKLAIPTPPPSWNLQTAFQTHMWESLLWHLIKPSFDFTTWPQKQDWGCCVESSVVRVYMTFLNNRQFRVF